MLIYTVDKENNLGHPTKRKKWILKLIENGGGEILKEYQNGDIEVKFLNKIFDPLKTIKRNDIKNEISS